MKNTDYIEFDDRVDRFLRKEMTPQEQDEFQKMLLENPPLLERAQTIAMTIKAMEAVQSQREDRLLRAIKNMDENDFRKLADLPLRQAPKMPKLARYAAAAAVVGMLCFGGSWYYKYDRTITLGETQYMAYVQELEQNLPLDLKIGYDYASSKGPQVEYSINLDVIRRSPDYPSKESIEVMQTLYPLFLKVRDGVELNQTLQELSPLYSQAKKQDSQYHDYVDDIAWNMAIAYLKVGDRDNPIPLLEDIVDRNKGFISRTQPAANLIEQIKAIK